MTAGAPGAAGALSGVRVVELTHFLAGPYAGMVLAGMGADVVKLEDPAHPDEARGMSPRDGRGESLYFMSLNLGKRSVGVNLSSEAGRRVALDLVRTADVVLDNYRPGVLAKLGLDHESLARVKPDLITCSLTGFGESGPYARRVGYDYTIQAMAGVMDLAGEPDGPPTKAGISYLDHSGGLAAAMACSAALVERSRTGAPRHIDLGLADVQYSMLSYLAAWSMNAGVVQQRVAASAHPSLVPAQNFRTRDGYLSLFVGNDAMWLRLAGAMGDPRLQEARYQTREGRLAHAAELIALLQNEFELDTGAAWADRLATAGVACAPVNTLQAALDDAHVHARDLVAKQDVGGHAFQHVRGPVIDLERSDVPPPPTLGQDSAEVLRELGYSAAEIESLRQEGVVVSSAA